MTSPSFDPSALAGNVLAAFASPFSQANRIVQLALAGGSGIAPDTLLAHRVIGHEAINDTYRITVDALSADSFIESKELLGQGAAITVRTAAGDERIVTGVVTQVGFGGMNGGLTRYLLRIEPLLATLAHRTNSRTFQDKTVIDIVTAILQEHIERNPVFAKYFALDNKANQTYPKRSYCQQYRETDQAFITRLLAEEGISFYWTYSNDDDVPVHTMTLFDDAYTPEEAMHARIRFHRADGTENEDSITGWQSARQIGPGRTSLGTYDYKRAATYSGSEHSSIHQSDHGNDLASTLESYHHQAPYYGADEAEMARYALLRQQAGDLPTKISTGAGTPRGLGAGRYFELGDHPVIDHDYQEDRQFVVLSLDWVAENNLPSDTANTLRTLFPQASMQQLAADANADARLVAPWRRPPPQTNPRNPTNAPSTRYGAAFPSSPHMIGRNMRSRPHPACKPLSSQAPPARKSSPTRMAVSKCNFRGSARKTIPKTTRTMTTRARPGCASLPPAPMPAGACSTSPELDRKY